MKRKNKDFENRIIIRITSLFLKKSSSTILTDLIFPNFYTTIDVLSIYSKKSLNLKGFPNLFVSKCKDAKVQGYKSARMQKCKDAKVQGRKSARTQ